MGQDTDPDLSAELTKWALSHGASIDGIAAHAFPGRGLGIIAQRRLEAGETILKVPTSLLRTESSLPDHLQSLAQEECSVNGLLALDVSLDNPSFSTSTSAPHSLWRSTLPSLSAMKSSMPLFWRPEAQDLLPPPGLALLRKQQAKLHRDWTAVCERGVVVAPQGLSLEQYIYRWLLVSTRTFYYTPEAAAAAAPSSKPRPPKSKSQRRRRRSKSNPKPPQPRPADDCLAIVPFGDFFNHTAGTQTVKATYSASGYDFVMTGPHAVAAGTELFISYGSHSNDFLLVEYGFILPDGDNAHDTLLLDDVVLALFSPEQTAVLDAAGYLGNYVLGAITGSSGGNGGNDNDDEANDDDAEVVCYRTTTALRLLCMPLRRWKRGLSCGFDHGDAFQAPLNDLVTKVLRTYIDMAGEKIQHVFRLDEASFADQKDVLTRRWGQILALLTAATNRIRI
ncbi:hypothetical protein G647_08534 [Cladophialophora carrionii CBS 160.54]|uniref:SET domain-containing protein n=1 Tax=Cladophialophora carrionii CBS 160.54 TaxID=1279043 RepID=V9D3C1_9EURO|nr:uncharacterized protein G647_08534 [Cladophialophora carrionii CBS 160.54]ETI20497.1 hypothetical protein G647_08534 [Cladophialophora carrionii CBS 160.54]